MRRRRRVFRVIGVFELVMGALLIPVSAPDIAAGQPRWIVPGAFSVLFLASGVFLLYAAGKSRR